MPNKRPAFESSLAFLREGYTFISARCDALGADLFPTRIAGRPVVCVRGGDAARMFYEGDRFTRQGALPPTVVHLLQDKGSVQTLDGAAHHHRKALFTSMMSPGSVASLTSIFERHWKKRFDGTEDQAVHLHSQARLVLTAAACEWATGQELSEPQLRQRAAEFGLMVDKAGTFGPSNWWAQLRRRSTERWARGIIAEIRSGGRPAAEETPAALIARHRSADGTLLPLPAAGVELLNVIRPIVAVDRFITFAGAALIEHPQWRRRFAAGESLEDLEPFAQEVRRYYPFFPAVGGVARKEFTWRDHSFRPGTWVLLDLYGTNHDPSVWADPEAFIPERFRSWEADPNTLVPQGGGYVETGHRCPGEDITLALVKAAVPMLAGSGRSVPSQDLTVPLTRMPSLPRSGILLGPSRGKAAV